MKQFVLSCVILCAALGIGGATAAQDLPALYDVTGVAAGDVLNIRAEPSARAVVVGTIAPDARGIEVVGLSGAWAVVNHADGTGYASLTYLRPAAGPGWGTLEVPLHCSGTEPFWGLVYDPGAGVAELSLFDDAPTELPVTDRWPTLPWSDVAAFGGAAGTVVIRPQACSDGMSDVTYGLAVDVLLSGASPGRYSGCCLLTSR